MSVGFFMKLSTTHLKNETPHISNGRHEQGNKIYIRYFHILNKKTRKNIIF